MLRKCLKQTENTLKAFFSCWIKGFQSCTMKSLTHTVGFGSDELLVVFLGQLKQHLLFIVKSEKH